MSHGTHGFKKSTFWGIWSCMAHTHFRANRNQYSSSLVKITFFHVQKTIFKYCFKKICKKAIMNGFDYPVFWLFELVINYFLTLYIHYRDFVVEDFCGVNIFFSLRGPNGNKIFRLEERNSKFYQATFQHTKIIFLILFSAHKL